MIVTERWGVALQAHPKLQIANSQHTVDKTVFELPFEVLVNCPDERATGKQSATNLPHINFRSSDTSDSSVLILSTTSGSGVVSPPSSIRILNLSWLPTAAWAISGI